MPRSFQRPSKAFALVALFSVGLLAASCGGGGGGAQGAGRGLVLLSFVQDSVDNAVLNERLIFEFSEAVNPATVTNASIQIREGGEFGATVPGVFISDGARVIFEPRLASLCDQSDSGFKPDTQYRVQVVGFPEEFSVRNTSGQPLNLTSTYEFHTREDTDPEKYADQIPAAGPTIVSTSPANGAQAVAVADGNQIELVVSENLDPCTVNSDTILVQIYETGDPTVFAPNGTGQASGFSSDGTNTGSTADQQPADHTTWGAGGGVTSYAGTPITLLCDVELAQDFNGTRILLTPLFGIANGAAKFPENCLVVVTVTFDVTDFGHQAMQPHIFSFTTENLASSTSTYAMLNKGETRYIKELTTAAVHPDPRAPERIQGYMLFAGDGDNGADPLAPSLPNSPGSGCLAPFQPNDGTTDDFAPAADVWLDTGGTLNTCPNDTDGSNAVVWEFASFRIASNVTVRVIGRNPAIILVQGDVIIENGGRLLVRGDGVGASPRGDGRTGTHYQSGNDGKVIGGVAVAGGGNGGTGEFALQDPKFGDDGFAGLGSPDYDPNFADNGVGEDGQGAGRAGQPIGTANSSVYNPWDGSSAGGGGGGHATAGTDGERKQGTVYTLKLSPRGQGGGVYERAGNSNDRLQKPEGGSGGGSAGFFNSRPFNTSTSYRATGGSGGAGGGFIDLTSSGDILILGTVDAAGGRGGSGTGWTQYSATGGGGGGSGGGIRLLTPNDIKLAPTSVVTAAGGLGGPGYAPQTAPANFNDGGDGGNGRIAMESGTSIISNLAQATVTPAEGQNGFYRGQFDATRFQGGGLSPKATTDIIPIGDHANFNPLYVEPVQLYGTQEDFKAGIPTTGTPGAGKTAILVEVRGYQMKFDGTLDAATETPWFSVGHFTDVGITTLPKWNAGHPSPIEVPFPSDNAGAGWQGFNALNTWGGGGYEFLQVRVTIFLPPTVGPFDPGSYLDDWTIYFTHDH